MSIFSNLLGSHKVISDGFKLIDDMHTSKVEEIGATSKAKTDLLSAYHPFKLAQRILAIIFAVTFVSSYTMVLVLYFNDASIDEVTDIITAFKIDWIMLTIVGFYFGGGAVEGIIAKKSK